MSQRTEYALVIVEGASLISLGCLAEPLEYVKQHHFADSMEVSSVMLKASAQSPAAGLQVESAGQLEALFECVQTRAKPAVVFLCCGFDVPHGLRNDLRRLIRSCKRNNVRMASIGAATWLMAEERALATDKCVIHRKSDAAFKERNLFLAVSNTLFDNDSQIASCAGELATLDLMIAFLRTEFGDPVAQGFCDHALVSFPRKYSSPQPGAAANRLRHFPNVVQSMVRDMCNNNEDPLPLEQLNKMYKMSRRQVERIFAKYLGCSPGKYYRDLQLEVAYQLAEQTELPLVEVSLASGFTTHSIMSRHFKQKFGRTPSELRRGLTMSTLQRG